MPWIKSSSLDQVYHMLVSGGIGKELGSSWDSFPCYMGEPSVKGRLCILRVFSTADLCRGVIIKPFCAHINAMFWCKTVTDFMQLALMAREMKEAFPGIELGSVDGMQGEQTLKCLQEESTDSFVIVGREKEAIIVTLVRSNSEHEG